MWSITLLEAGYHCARAFILAELAASVEWQLHCALWPVRSPWEPLSLLLLALVYGALFGGMSYLLHIRPQPASHLQISGSAALAVGGELMAHYGVDSLVGRTAAVMLGSTETTFYTLSVYFGAAGISKTRYTLPAALFADFVGFLAASWSVRFLFGS